MALRTTRAKIYLGDAVYVRVDSLGNLVLTTEDGISPTSMVVLEPEVLANLLAFVRYKQREVDEP
jgi:hypothetical protein